MKSIRTSIPERIYQMIVFGERNDVKRHFKWHRFQTQTIFLSKEEIFEARDLAFEDLQRFYPVKTFEQKSDRIICYNSTNSWTVTIFLRSYPVLTPSLNDYMFGTIEGIMRGKYLV